ncbi:MAG: histidine kinase [Bacteroidia bacterium]|nr:histidine kinase [Bacteroidia bacterium]
MNQSKVFLSFLFLIFSLGDGFSQEPLFRSFEPKLNGNKMNLHTLVIDNYGKLLCGTNEGVMIFDGSSFLPAFVNDSSVKISVQSLFKDRTGKVWVGFKNGRIGIINQNRFSWFVPSSGFPSTPITDITEDKTGRMFFTTEGEGLWYGHNENLKKINRATGLSDDFCYKIIALPDGRICVATDQGINFIGFDGENIWVKILSSEDGLPDNIVRHMTLDRNNVLWVGLQDKGYCQVNLTTEKIIVPVESGDWKFGQVNTIIALEQEVWLGTEKYGLFRLEKNGSTYPLKVGKNGLKNNSIKILLADPEGNVWIGSNNELIQANGELWSKLSDASEIQPFRFIHCILQDKNGDIWFSPDQQLFRAKKMPDGSYSYKKYLVTQVDKLTDIVTLFQDSRNFIWIGTLGEGVFIFDPLTEKLSHLIKHPVLVKGNILSIEQSGSKMRIGGFGGIHSFEMNYIESRREYELREIEANVLRELSHNYIYSIHTDKKGRTWFGSDEKGLAVLEDDRIKFFTKTDGLPVNTVLSITSDSKGQIWLATQGGGISVFDENKFVTFSVAEGLSDPSPASIIIDPHDRIIVPHTNGIDILDPTTRSFQYYGSTTGLEEINPDMNTVCKGPDGKIWIGTEKGIYSFRSSQYKNWIQPDVKLTNISLYLEPLNSFESSVFKHDQNNFSFDYHATWYTDPNRISYSYNLEGYSDKWQVTKDQTVNYPKLPPGDYVFHVKASLNNRFESASEATFKFTIKSPLWQQAWFRILLSLGIVMMAWLIVRRRELRLRKQEKEEKEKIEFQFETLRSQVNPHFLFNSFNTLITVIEKDPHLAVEYVEHLSAFFRNIVGYKDLAMIPLSEELSLLKNYLFIQTKRFGTNLNLKTEINEDLSNKLFIPPLTLQLLAENAIKHNAVSHESPLTIELSIRNEHLEVRNNINPKYKVEESTRMGLQNIINRYKILTSGAVEIKNDTKFFSVSVPLLKDPKA